MALYILEGTGNEEDCCACKGHKHFFTVQGFNAQLLHYAMKCKHCKASGILYMDQEAIE